MTMTQDGLIRTLGGMVDPKQLEYNPPLLEEPGQFLGEHVEQKLRELFDLSVEEALIIKPSDAKTLEDIFAYLHELGPEGIAERKEDIADGERRDREAAERDGELESGVDPEPQPGSPRDRARTGNGPWPTAGADGSAAPGQSESPVGDGGGGHAPEQGSADGE